MANIITSSYFTGEVQLSLQAQELSKLNALITDREESILTDLLGAELYNNLMDDLDTNGNPQTQKYIDLVDGVTYTDDDSYIINFKGLRYFLKYLLFSEYCRANDYKATPSGLVQNVGDNATKSDMLTSNRYFNDKWNTGVKFMRLTVRYLIDNYLTYWTDERYPYWSPIVYGSRGGLMTITYSNKNFYNYKNKAICFKNA